MVSFRVFAAGMIAAVTLGSTASAEDLALVLSNRVYDRAGDVAGSREFRRTPDLLRQAGFRVISSFSDSSSTQREHALDFEAAVTAGEADRILIILSGHVVKGPRDSWLLGREAGQVSAVSVGASALSVSALTELAARAPGRAVVMIADSDVELPLGAGMAQGAGRVKAPQGVTLIKGSAGALNDVLKDGILDPSKSLARVEREAGDNVEFSGFVSATNRFMAGTGGAPTGGLTGTQDVGELAYWNAAQDIGTLQALRSYVERFPDGRFTAEATARIREIEARPGRRAQEAEEALELDRDQRRAIQRNLSLLGYDTRGIDGIFGQGTRTAIRSWQDSINQEGTGFLTRFQLGELRRAAHARAAEVQEEARRRQQEQEARDRAYWAETGSAGRESGLRAYLERYPDGLFAERAQGRLNEIQESRRAEAAQELRAAWDEARERNDLQGYRAFLERYPNSSLTDEAQARIRRLQARDVNREQIERDRTEEAQLAATQSARLIIERRLANVGQDTGEVDGRFTRETRRAIRRFQRARGVEATGFVSRQTLVLLLSIGEQAER